jgi:hypothetical protein
MPSATIVQLDTLLSLRGGALAFVAKQKSGR